MSSSLPPAIDDDDDKNTTGFVGLFDCASMLHAKIAPFPLLLLFANETVFSVPSFLRKGCCCCCCCSSRWCSKSSTLLATKTRSRASLDFPAPILLLLLYRVVVEILTLSLSTLRALLGNHSFAPSHEDTSAPGVKVNRIRWLTLHHGVPFLATHAHALNSSSSSHA